jgi:prefoldin subunit 5
MSAKEKKVTSTDGSLEAEIHDVEDELHDVEEELHEFEVQQTGISRTLQIIVYPSLVAFVVLAAYGFYLVQSLTTDVHRLTETIASMNETVDRNLNNISDDMGKMNGNITSMAASTDSMSQNITQMTGNTHKMTTDLNQMNVSTQNMAASTYNMQRDMWSMNKNVSKPFKAMGKFLPFGSSDTNPYMVSPPPLPYYGVQNTNGWYAAPVQQQPQSLQQGVVTQPAPAAGGNTPQQTQPAGNTTTVTGEGQSFFNTNQFNTLANNQ